MLKTKAKRSRVFAICFAVFGAILIAASFIAYFSAKWYVDVYGQIGFEAILYTLRSGLRGSDQGLITAYFSAVIPRTLFACSIICVLLFFRSNKKLVLTLFQKLRMRLFPFSRRVCTIVIFLLCGSLLFSAARISQLDAYILNLLRNSDIYENEYRDPKTVSISFPEKKRNLVYIFMESMETSYLSKELGGTLQQNAIPELYALAQENINFSHNNDVGGFTVAPGTEWTIGAMVGHTAAIPLKIPPGIDPNNYGADGKFLPGVTTLTDILRENGYYQTLMVGSDATFGGRKQYYTSHGVDRVYDLFTAREDGVIPPDYHVWWGYEDRHLFTYAQQALTEISQQDQPFAFTMLTVDTHHIDGYRCQYCENTHEEQYENVISCASRQVTAFIRWLQAQPFYENTTIVIAGDHPSMDNGFFSRVADENYQRHIYNCFINAPISAENTKNRNFCTFDMLPTTLAAMGCSIEGDRLGFGTNLFSSLSTLTEKTNNAIFQEYKKNADYYYRHFYD